MRHLIAGFDNEIGSWVSSRCGVPWVPGMGRTIGLWDAETNTLVAGAIFHDWNPCNCFVTLATDGSKKALNRRFMQACARYVFVQMGCKRVTCLVASGNAASIKLCESAGWELETTLEGAHPDGDLIVFRMWAKNCKWLTLRKADAEHLGNTIGS